MTRIAVITDVHANLQAFEAIAEDLDFQSPDLVVFLGDLVMTGPRPAEVLSLMEVLDPAIWIKGNTDDWPSEVNEDFQPKGEMESLIKDMTLWAGDRLPSGWFDAMARRPIYEEIAAEGRTIAFCHGSPRSFSEGILPEMPDGDLDAALGNRSFSVLCCGHTHHRFVLERSGKTVLNFGAVSIPPEPGDRTARYGIIDLSPDRLVYRPRDISYAFRTFISDIRDGGFPGRDLVLGKYGVS